MKKIILIIIFFISVNSFSQSNPIDTSFHNNGSVRSILYQNDSDMTGYQVEAFYNKSDNIKKLGTRLTDTVYEHQPKWPVISEIKSLNKNLIRLSRNYLPDSSYIEKHISVDSQATFTFFFSSIAIYFKKEKISITYQYKNNKLIALYIGEEEFFPHKNYKNIVEIFSEKEIGFKHQEYFLTKSRKIRIENFDSSKYISRIIFMDSKGFWNGSYIELYSNATPKEFGKNELKKRVGTWYEWDSKGILRANGNYGDTKFDKMDNPTYLKEGIWIYYDEKGNHIKKEIWKSGKLLGN